MKNNRLKWFLLLLAFGLLKITPSSAQNIEEDFQRISKKYEEVESLSLEMEAYAFQGAEDKKGQLTFKGSFRKYQDQVYTNTGDHEMLIQDEEMIIVNHQRKKIVIGKAKDRSQMGIPQAVFSLDSLLASGGKAQLLRDKNGLRKYQVEMPKSLLNKIEIEIDDLDLIRRMVYHYQAVEKAQPAYSRIEIDYQNIRLDPPDASWFDEKKYLRRVKGGAEKPAPKFQDYIVSKVDYSSYLEN